MPCVSHMHHSIDIGDSFWSCPAHNTKRDQKWYLCLLVDPVGAVALVVDNLALAEPESNLLLGILDAVGTVADVAANIDGKVTTDGARGRGKRVGGTKEDTASLDGITSLPNHGGDRAAQHVLNQAGEERLLLEVGVVSLEVLLARANKLEGYQLVASVLKAADDGTNEATLDAIRLDSNESLLGRHLDFWFGSGLWWLWEGDGIGINDDSRTRWGRDNDALQKFLVVVKVVFNASTEVPIYSITRLPR
jgi:hypothetical protein